MHKLGWEYLANRDCLYFADVHKKWDTLVFYYGEPSYVSKARRRQSIVSIALIKEPSNCPGIIYRE
jgi:hypothetical protein